MHRLEKLCNKIRQTNSVVMCPKLTRYLCTEKLKDQGIKDSLGKSEDNSISSQLTDNLLENSNDNTQQNNNELSGFAKSVEKYKSLSDEKVKKGKSFATLLRHSKLIDIGDPNGKIVKGKVVHVVDNDLHIDFGWKFNCVCRRPSQNASDYVRGSIVRLKIKELELSTRFLGSTKDLTILEADCILLGLLPSQQKVKNTQTEAKQM
ncbi:28S ribosomal protein S28, mitochondrial [Leptopilina boulardi]|uniref:28S ribosomal protein S28, mitochondrial n=1 Tax=Leptopilina boulardi TaxID=63433 RepID=UPI0021F5336C|nr:28S ribosomal protein S28, mitochondrial [Leptopilina boulardi]